MKIYVAGKITGLSRREVEGKFRATAETLKNEGHDVFIDAVYMLSDWRLCVAMLIFELSNVFTEIMEARNER